MHKHLNRLAERVKNAGHSGIQPNQAHSASLLRIQCCKLRKRAKCPSCRLIQNEQYKFLVSASFIRLLRAVDVQILSNELASQKSVPVTTLGKAKHLCVNVTHSTGQLSSKLSEETLVFIVAIIL